MLSTATRYFFQCSCKQLPTLLEILSAADVIERKADLLVWCTGSQYGSKAVNFFRVQVLSTLYYKCEIYKFRFCVVLPLSSMLKFFLRTHHCVALSVVKIECDTEMNSKT